MKFGTDGIRGIAYEELSEDVAYKTGNAIGGLAENSRAIIGRDTRLSGEDLTRAFCKGFTDAGGEIMDCGLMPTAGVAYLAIKHRCDYGIVISASHNPPEYNGIKVFDGKGYKISESLEREIEDRIAGKLVMRKGGSMSVYDNGCDEYVDFLAAKGVNLDGVKILLDCSNGATSQVAPKVFKKLGADITVVNDSLDGSVINKDCGAVCAELLSDRAKNYDITFSFDGDGDRLIALDENGEIVDGDKNLLVIGKYLKARNLLKGNLITGTLMTNIGIQREIEEQEIEFDRADVGDKYVLRNLLAKGGILGGEGSGHTLILSESTTGDGVQTAVVIAKIFKESKRPLSVLAKADLVPQITKSIKVEDKEKIAQNPKVAEAVEKIKSEFKDEGRVLVRPSGTENKLRITLEYKDENRIKEIVNDFTKLIQNIEI